MEVEVVPLYCLRHSKT